MKNRRILSFVMIIALLLVTNSFAPARAVPAQEKTYSEEKF